MDRELSSSVIKAQARIDHAEEKIPDHLKSKLGDFRMRLLVLFNACQLRIQKEMEEAVTRGNYTPHEDCVRDSVEHIWDEIGEIVESFLSEIQDVLQFSEQERIFVGIFAKYVLELMQQTRQDALRADKHPLDFS